MRVIGLNNILLLTQTIFFINEVLQLLSKIACTQRSKCFNITV